MTSGRVPRIIPVKPWYQDHFFGDKIVLPAVETMLLLAAYVLESYPASDIKSMEDARFAKFLEIAPGTAFLIALFECADVADGRVRAKLLSRIQGKSMSRIKEHCEVFFSATQAKGPEESPVMQFTPAPPTGSIAELEADHLYRELVPFGPNYRTLQGSLYLFEHEAWGKLHAPELPLSETDAVQKNIGSPFPLDGALHAACVLGQRSVSFVPFPVGFARRTVVRPTRPGGAYIAKVRQTAHTDDELVFDLAIWDNDGQLYEMVTGLQMRDVRGVFKKS